jgi:hypothetical protein
MTVDRKALIREYKQSRRPMGVYRVRNTAEGKALLGSSNDLPAILNRHRAQLRMGVHNVRELQQDWNRLGAEAFTFEVLDTLEPPDDTGYDSAEDLDVLLEMWREKATLAGDSAYRL